MKKAILALVTAALASVTCHQALFVAPPGSTMELFANPPFISAHGGVSIITAFLIEPAGTPVADGTVVQCFSDLGRVDEQARTNDGVARLNFVSDSRSGRATITCCSGGGTAPAPSPSPSPTPGPGGETASAAAAQACKSVTVDIGSTIPTRIFLRAVPPRITESRSTHIIATVVDSRGNPVFNVPVFFEVVDNPATEFMDRQGPVFTNQNGEAEDVMRTRRTSAGTAQVRARTTNNVVSDALNIPIVF
jgi:hypothetical protein